MAEEKQYYLPEIPGATRLIAVSWRILDAFGVIETEGTIKLTTSRWVFSEPYLMAEVIEALGRKVEEFTDPKRRRFSMVWSFLPLDHPLDSSEERWIDWAKNPNPKIEKTDPAE